MVKDAIREFNVLSRKHHLGVSLNVSGNPAINTGGADVSIQAAAGTAAFTDDGETRTGSFSGTAKHGLTLLFSRDGFLEKASIFLPSHPQVNTPPDNRIRPVRPNVMKLIAIHELVHAC